MADFHLSFIEVPPTESSLNPGVYVQVSGLVSMLEMLEQGQCQDPHVQAHFREVREALQRGVARAIEASRGPDGS